jgi:biopolymer transport protein ExbD
MKSTQPRWALASLKRRNQNELLCRMDMWGFVSVMLAILVWTRFGLPHPAHSYRSSVDWAIAVHSSPQPGALKEDAMLISITRDSRVFFRDRQIAPKDLPEEIREGFRLGAEKKVYLAVDALAEYGDVPVILDKIRLAGIENVSFLTEKPYR